MSWLRRLERQLQPLAIPNLTTILVVAMAVVYLVSLFREDLGGTFEFRPSAVLKGEVWRVFTFLVQPATHVGVNPWNLFVFIIFLSATHLMGSALEATWGTVRYNVFVFISYVSSIGAGVLAGAVIGDNAAGTNLFLYTSIYLAFAWLYPDFEFMLYWLFPVKVKWLGLLAAAMMMYQFMMGLATFGNGGWLTCTLILTSTINLSLFIGPEIATFLLRRNRQMLRRFGDMNQHQPLVRHTCIVCGATDLTHPDRQFRYCTQCQGTPAYCDQHLAGHQHLTAVATEASNKPAT
jgi:hypothetical protein